jgi:hypothetical protein
MFGRRDSAAARLVAVPFVTATTPNNSQTRMSELKDAFREDGDMEWPYRYRTSSNSETRVLAVSGEYGKRIAGKPDVIAGRVCQCPADHTNHPESDSFKSLLALPAGTSLQAVNPETRRERQIGRSSGAERTLLSYSQD